MLVPQHWNINYVSALQERVIAQAQIVRMSKKPLLTADLNMLIFVSFRKFASIFIKYLINEPSMDLAECFMTFAPCF